MLISAYFKKSIFSATPKETIIAADPNSWFQYLKKENCKYLRLFFQHSKETEGFKDRMLSGFVGSGGTWLIEAVGNKYSNYWMNRWEVTNQNSANRKIWSVSYGLGGKQQRTSDVQIDNMLAKEKIKDTLGAIAKFAYDQNYHNWGKQFDNAMQVLDSNHPAREYYHHDLIPVHNYSLTAQQLLFAAGKAWVFGGMGSWNDLGFANQQDQLLYDSLSEQLYDNIIEAVIASVNSF